MSHVKRGIESDVVVVGSGPGGGSVAWELSKLGKKVVLCEAGKYNKVGKLTSMAGMMEKGQKSVTREGMRLSVGKTVGGTSVMYAASVLRPPRAFTDKTGIDLEKEMDEVYHDFPFQPLPDSHLTPGYHSIMESALEMGLDWNKLDKWISPDKCVVNCGKCAFGCTTGAKITARTYVDQAALEGVQLLTETDIEKVLEESGKAVGVRARDSKGWFDIKAQTVVLSAGGIGTPSILQRSGIYDAGSHFFVDPIIPVWGVGPNVGNIQGVPMSAGTYLKDDGIFLFDVSSPVILNLLQLGFAGLKGLSFLRKATTFKTTLGVSAKVIDNGEGRIHPDKSSSITFDTATLNRLNKGALLGTEILINAGVKREDTFVGVPLGGHLGGTAAIGRIVDENCETEIKDCYCLDTSIIPESYAIPMSAMIVAMGKRLARHLKDKF